MSWFGCRLNSVLFRRSLALSCCCFFRTYRIWRCMVLSIAGSFNKFEMISDSRNLGGWWEGKKLIRSTVFDINSYDPFCFCCSLCHVLHRRRSFVGYGLHGITKHHLEKIWTEAAIYRSSFVVTPPSFGSSLENVFPSSSLQILSGDWFVTSIIWPFCFSDRMYLDVSYSLLVLSLSMMKLTSSLLRAFSVFHWLWWCQLSRVKPSVDVWIATIMVPYECHTLFRRVL